MIHIPQTSLFLGPRRNLAFLVASSIFSPRHVQPSAKSQIRHLDASSISTPLVGLSPRHQLISSLAYASSTASSCTKGFLPNRSPELPLRYSATRSFEMEDRTFSEGGTGMGTVRANSAIMKDHRLGNELWANNSESESWLFSSRTSPSWRRSIRRHWWRQDARTAAASRMCALLCRWRSIMPHRSRGSSARTAFSSRPSGYSPAIRPERRSPRRGLRS